MAAGHADDSTMGKSIAQFILAVVVVVVFGCAPQPPKVVTGIEAMKRDGFRQLSGRKVGVITNHTGVDNQGNRLIDLLHQAKGVEVVAIYSPEHGLYGTKDEKIEDMADPKTGLKVYSLYGKTRRPTTQMVKGIDTLVYDIQDVGARFYTYETTMAYGMEAAKEHGLKFVLLDRPNPITGVRVDGPVADKAHLGFTAYGPIPVMHGMTLGELAKLDNEHFKIGCDLTVVQMEGWKREMWWEETGLKWINPSPNMRSVTEAALYPGVCLLEASNVSVGRGTKWPFEIVGAPWINENALAKRLNAMELPGVKFTAVEFKPTESKHKGKQCGGVRISVKDRSKLKPVELGVVMAWTLHAMYQKEFEYDKVHRLLQNSIVAEKIPTLLDPREARRLWERDLEEFMSVREKYLIYR
jgi:uncharacterized protein YbbC (DUF1343 family)